MGYIAAFFNINVALYHHNVLLWAIECALNFNVGYGSINLCCHVINLKFSNKDVNHALEIKMTSGVVQAFSKCLMLFN